MANVTQAMASPTTVTDEQLLGRHIGKDALAKAHRQLNALKQSETRLFACRLSYLIAEILKFPVNLAFPGNQVGFITHKSRKTKILWFIRDYPHLTAVMGHQNATNQ